MNYQNQKILKRIFSYSKPSQKKIKQAILFSSLNKLFDIAPEILIGVAVDLVVRKKQSMLSSFGFSDPLHQLMALCGLTFLVWSCESLFQYLYSIRWKSVAQSLQHLFRINTYQHLQNLEMSWFEKNSIGNIQTILNDDINQLERFLDTGFNEIIQIVVSTILIGCIFVYISPLLALGTILPIPFIFIGIFLFQKNIQPKYEKVRHKAGKIGSRLENHLLGMTTIKSYTAEDYHLEKIKEDSNEYCLANQQAIYLSSAFIPIIRIVILCGFIITLGGGGWLTLQEQLTVGAYSVLIFLTQRFLWPFTSLGQMIDNFSRSMASAKRIFSLLDTKINQPTNTSNKKPTLGNIEFKQVSFSYQSQRPLFTNLNLTIPHNKTVAFVGATGSGKTTLTRLLLRFNEIQTGEILIGDTSSKDLSLQTLREQITYVAQDALIFPGTFVSNIAFGEKTPDIKKVQEAIKFAELDSTIKDFPENSNSTIGERGQNLSGGQRQRIALARAFYKSSAILIFDEATSQVDTVTEALIHRSLKKLSQGKTTIIIAHRLWTIKDVDLIYVLDQGKIISQGDHKTLLQICPTYKNLWQGSTI
jgi:ATP-binding cassette, subfamily B, bacterial